MVVKIGYLGNLLGSLLYKDRLTRTRVGKDDTRNPDGSMRAKVLDSFLLEEPCLVHETANDSSRDGNLDIAVQEVTITVFCSNSCDIVRGDVLKLSVMDDNGQVRKVITGKAAQPTYYPDHLEIDLYEWKVS